MLRVAIRHIDSRMFQAKEALQDLPATFGGVEFSLWRYAQTEGGMTCTNDAQCPDTPAGQSHLTCENIDPTKRCMNDAANLGSADGQCDPST